MIFIRVIRWLLGYVKFTAKGGFPERFLNLCAMSNIPLWNVKNLSGTIHVETTIKGYKNIRENARKSGMKARLSQKCGLPFFVYHHKKRVGLLIGLALTVIIISFLSTMLWTIDVQGNEDVTKDEILEVFEELGVEVGCFKKKLDISSIELEASQRLQDLAWLSLNINGSKAVIEVRERTKIPEIVDVETPCNVIAEYGGQIIKYEVYSGLAQQQISAAVAKGDLLISGVVENSDGSVRFIHARGKITALTRRNIAKKCFSTQLITRVSKKKQISKLYFFGLKIPLGFLSKTENMREYETEYMMTAGRTRLPLGIIKKGYFKTETQKETVNEKQCELTALDGYFREVLKQMDDAEIIEQDISVNRENGNVEISGNFRCEEEIGKQQKIYVEEIIEN